MMVYPYRGEDMECAAVARATMVANSQTHGTGNMVEDSLGIYSSESDAEFSVGGASNSVSTSRLVGTFYNPNTASDTNSMVSSLQDELSNSPPPEHNYSRSHGLGLPGKELSPQDTLGLPPANPRRRMFWIFLFALCLLVGIATSMGILIGVNHEKSKTSAVMGPPTVGTTDESDTALGANASSSDTDMDAITTPPMDQSSGPTMAPSPFQTRPNSTTQSINAFVQSLPSYTQAALETPTSPQQRALNWLTKDSSLLSYSKQQLLQRFVLKTFFFSTNGDNDELDSEQQWLRSEGWSSSSLSSSNEHECQWLTTFQDDTIEPACNEEGIYTVLSVRRNNLRGLLPRELALLTSLRVLDLELNSIQSDIPTEMGLLTHLERLVLGGNDLTGTVPTELGQLTLLVGLELENNALSGSIPKQLGQLHPLVNLTLDDNQFQGAIPSQLGALTLLENMLLHGNTLSGAIPSEVGQWTQLKSLSLRNNLLSSSLPTEMGLLYNLERLWAYQNELNGPIPTQLGQARRLTQLSLSRNMLTGQIPSTLGQLTRLMNLWLYRNQLTGSLPTELGLLTELELLPVRDNEIRGAVPQEICAIEQLEVTVDCLEVACDCECTCASEEEVNDDL